MNIREMRTCEMRTCEMRTYIAQPIIKSNIQILQDRANILANLKDAVRQFVKLYNTDNMIYGIIDNNISQLEQGYLAILEQDIDLESALHKLSNIDFTRYPNGTPGVQILGLENENRVYRVGIVYESLTDIPEDIRTIVNIMSLEDM